MFFGDNQKRPWCTDLLEGCPEFEETEISLIHDLVNNQHFKRAKRSLPSPLSDGCPLFGI